MAGSYRPRPAEVKPCNHCGNIFETRHKRTIYCGESCRQLAYQARHRSDQDEPRKAKGNLAFSVQNVGVTATGAAVAAVGNYLFNDRPTQQVILSKLDSIESGTEQGLNELLSAAQLMVDYVNVQVEKDLMLQNLMDKKRIERLQQEVNQIPKEGALDRLLSKNSY